jgi:hypothetical protein
MLLAVLKRLVAIVKRRDRIAYELLVMASFGSRRIPLLFIRRYLAVNFVEDDKVDAQLAYSIGLLRSLSLVKLELVALIQEDIRYRTSLRSRCAKDSLSCPNASYYHSLLYSERARAKAYASTREAHLRVAWSEPEHLDPSVVAVFAWQRIKVSFRWRDLVQPDHESWPIVQHYQLTQAIMGHQKKLEEKCAPLLRRLNKRKGYEEIEIQLCTAIYHWERLGKPAPRKYHEWLAQYRRQLKERGLEGLPDWDSPSAREEIKEIFPWLQWGSDPGSTDQARRWQLST